MDKGAANALAPNSNCTQFQYDHLPFSCILLLLQWRASQIHFHIYCTSIRPILVVIQSPRALFGFLCGFHPLWVSVRTSLPIISGCIISSLTTCVKICCINAPISGKIWFIGLFWRYTIHLCSAWLKWNIKRGPVLQLIQNCRLEFIISYYNCGTLHDILSRYILIYKFKCVPSVVHALVRRLVPTGEASVLSRLSSSASDSVFRIDN